jgi:magnesium chelatase family protein
MISHIRQFCVAADCERLLERAMAQQGPTARAHDRNPEGCTNHRRPQATDPIGPKHVAEAIQYRTLDRNFWA